MDPARPSAQLIGIRAGKITSVATNEALDRLRGKDTILVDCRGRVVLPGFIDAHCHIHGYAESLVSLDLSPRAQIRSISDIQERIGKFCQNVPAGTWARGKNYDEFWLAEKRHPDRRDLDAAAPDHPVKLTHRSGHAHVLNSLALKLAGIGDETGDPPGGIIDRDTTGAPTGILYGLGGFLAGKIPPLSDAETERGIGLANAQLVSRGVTSVQDASPRNGPAQWERFETWKAAGLFQPRLTVMTGLEAFLRSDGDVCCPALKSDELRPGAVKIVLDKATGSLYPSRDELDRAVLAIHASNRQAAIHAIEEPAIEAAADAIERALQKIPRKDHRHRIEHCSLCTPRLLRRLARLGIAAVTNPSFIHFSGARYLETVPLDQQEFLYPVRSMLESGLLVGAGSDAPIAEPDPLLSIGASVTRCAASGGSLPQQRISLAEALRIHTTGAAAAAFEEDTKGSLTPGKAADIVMLSENPFSIPPERIKDIRVVMTMIGGRIVNRCDL